MAVFALSVHADYRCRQSGLCCAADWDVPVELPVFRTLQAALDSGRLRPAGTPFDGTPPLITGDDLPPDTAAMLARTTEGACVFQDRGSRLCVVHRDFGETLLPATCRHYPRLAVRDRRGTFISLTHYCPTAAGLLFRDDVSLTIVEAPPAFPDADYEGLEVAPDAWPPLLHPRMLMDLDGYSAWERHMVARCADAAATPESVVATLWRDARLLRRFVADGGSLSGVVAALPADVVPAAAPPALDASLADLREVMRAVPDELRPAPDEARLGEAYEAFVLPAWYDWRLPLNRYVAGKAFANWTAYQGRGVLSIVRGLEAALGLVRVEAARGCRDAARRLDRDLLVEAMRRADFALNHLAMGDELATGWSVVEDAEPPAADANSAITGP